MNGKYFNIRGVAFGIIALGLGGSPVAASSVASLSLLELSGGARANGLYGAYTAVAGDGDSIFYNPAGLAALGRNQLGVTHAELFANAQFDAVTYGQKWGDRNSLGVSVTRLGIQGIDGRDTQGQNTGDLSSEDMGASIALAREITSQMGIGMNVKMVKSRIANQQAGAMAGDAGVVSKIPHQMIWWGASVSNIGPGLKYADQTEQLPLTFSVGSAVRVAGFLNVTADLKRQPRAQETTFVSGIEYSASSALSLRMGADAPFGKNSTNGFASIQNLRGGMGLRLSNWQLDYVIAPFGDLGNTHRFTFTFDF